MANMKNIFEVSDEKTTKEKYENQKNFCSEFMECFVNLYCDSMEKVNKEFSEYVKSGLKEEKRK